MKLERIKDYLLLESEFSGWRSRAAVSCAAAPQHVPSLSAAVRNQEVLKPKAERETEQRDKVGASKASADVLNGGGST